MFFVCVLREPTGFDSEFAATGVVALGMLERGRAGFATPDRYNTAASVTSGDLQTTNAGRTDHLGVWSVGRKLLYIPVYTYVDTEIYGENSLKVRCKLMKE